MPEGQVAAVQPDRVTEAIDGGCKSPQMVGDRHYGNSVSQLSRETAVHLWSTER
jgi:hypothetical protein